MEPIPENVGRIERFEPQNSRGRSFPFGLAHAAGLAAAPSARSRSSSQNGTSCPCHPDPSFARGGVTRPNAPVNHGAGSGRRQGGGPQAVPASAAEIRAMLENAASRNDADRDKLNREHFRYFDFDVLLTPPLCRRHKRQPDHSPVRYR